MDVVDITQTRVDRDPSLTPALFQHDFDFFRPATPRVRGAGDWDYVDMPPQNLHMLPILSQLTSDVHWLPRKSKHDRRRKDQDGEPLTSDSKSNSKVAQLLPAHEWS